MTDDVLPDFGRSDDMVLPVFDRGALAVAEQEQQRQRGEPNLPAPAYPPAVDLGFGGPARSQMTFGENVAGSFFTNTLPGVIGEAASNEAARGNAQPGGFQPSQLRNLSARNRAKIEAESPEDAAARREAAYQRVFDQAAYDLSQSRITPQSVAGTVVGALADPVNVLSVPARVAIRGGEMALAGIRAVAPRLGRSDAAARIAQSGVDAAITNTAIDPILQAGRIQSGGQEGYNPEQTALAPIVGGAAGAAIRGALEVPSFARREAQAFGVDPARIETPQSVGTEAAGVPAGAAGEARIATPEAPIAREGQVLPDAGPVQRQAETVSPEPARIEAPAREPVDRGAAVEAVPAPARELPAVRADAAPEPPQARVAPIGDAVASIPQHRVATTAGSSIEVVPVVVESSAVRASSDAGYDASIQPRDRDRAASQAQIREMASRLDPERLGFSSEADRGAPIVGPDGMVESGNGRVMAIRQAYAAGGEAAQRYRDWLTRQGVDVSRFREPVIVRQRITDLTPEQRARFAVEANQAATLQMSAAERAIADARMMSADMFDLLRDPSNLMAAANRDFVRAFVRGLPQTEQGSLVDAGGILSQEGASRVRNAVLASAYGDSPVLTRVSESTDDNAKSLSNGLVMAAPEWARLKADIGSGRVPAEFDLTPQLMEAVTRTIDLRSRGMNLKSYMAQMDAFDRLTDNVDRFMRMFYDPKGSRAASAERISDAVRFYAQEARKVSADMGLDLGLARVTPDEIQGASLGRGQNEGQQNLFGSGARDGEGGDQGRFAALGQKAGRGSQAGEVGGDIAPMARQTADTTADRRFPGRQELPGEASKPRSLPENIRPEDIRDFRVTELMREIAARMDRKLEVDGRFTLRNAEGQYDYKQGVLRIRKEGDYEVFSHELGHAIEQQLARDIGPRLNIILKQHAAELKRLDINTDNPADQTVAEGFAEFVRRLINNPAYAAKQAPGFAPVFSAMLDAHAPQIRDIINDATLISRIDGGLDPVQSIKSTIAPAVEPRGVKKFMDEWRRSNLPVTMGLWADRAYAATVDRGHWVKRFVQTLTEGRFKKTGRPMPEFGWNDPTKMFRALDGAKQAAVDAFQNGVRDYGRALDGPSSPSLHAALKEAGNGSIGRMLDERSEGYRDFNAYLIARRSLGEYERFRAGDLPNPPVRQTENEIAQAIASIEAANPTFRSAADKVFGFSRAMLRKKFEAGLVSKEFYDAVTARGMDYVPFFRDMMGDDSPTGGGGSNGVQRNLEGQRFTGSTRDIQDPIQSLMLDTAMAERVIARNDFWTAMHRLAKQGGEFSGRFLEEIPNSKLKGVSIDVEEALKAKARERGLSPEDTQNLISSLEEMVGEDMTATLFRSQEITPGGERIVFRYEAGKRIAMKLGSDEYSRGLFEVMEGMSAAERDVMLAMFGKANAMFAQFITNAPEFALKNLVMDNLSRLFIARHTGVLGRVPFASLAQGVYTHIFDKEFSKTYAAMGGIRGGVVSAASRDLERTGGLEALSLTPQGTMGSIKDMVGNVRTPADVLKAGASIIGKGVEGYFKLIEATETAGRLGQAKFVFEHLKKQGLSDYEAMHAALYEARDVLDYDRRGTAMKTANRLMPFFNVGIQGIDRGLRNLVSDPLAAALQAYQRGGYANVDEAGKTALRDAVINWGMIAAAAVVTLGYHAAVSDDPVYRRQSDYMRKRYFILPMGQDASGRDYFISVPKPFDLPGGILSAVEAAADGIKRADPEAYGRVSKGLAEGFIPRQLAGFVEGPWTGFRDLFAAQPVPKVIAEAATGRRLGFEGSGPSDIVPMGLRGLMPADQWTGNTSFLAKKIGAATNSSPLMIDHVMNGLGATTARAFNDVVTAIFDNNPNMTPKDATTRLFFNGLYRGVRGVGSDRSEVTQLMGRDGAKYMAPALSYAAAIERGDTTRSEQIYQSADSIGKALMTLRGHSFAPAERQLHPLQSAETWAATVGAITRDLSQNRIEVQNRSRRRGEQRETIDLEPGMARSIINTMNAMAAEEIRNGLSTAGIPGYQGLPVIDTKARLDAIRALNPQVADEIQNRITRAHIIPAETLREKWPEVQRRLSTDRQLATLNDLLPAGASQAARRAAGRSLRTRQRVEESNNSD